MEYILKTITRDFTAYKGFKWAETVGATVTAPDWKPTQKCGNGLHGWLNGVGDGTIGYISDDCIWMVLETESYIDLQDKVKFESCTILHIGTQLSATKFLRGLVPFVVGMIGENVVDEKYATAGNYGTATAGDEGIIQIKYWESRWKIKIGYIGEDGLLPDTPYKLDENYNFVAI